MTRTFRLIPGGKGKKMVMDDLEYLLAQWCAWQQTQGLSERSITERAACVRRYARDSGEKPLAFTTGRMMLFIARPELAARSRWTYWQHLRAYSQWLMKAELRADDPLAKAPTPRKPAGTPRPVLDHQLTAILDAAKRRKTRTMVLLAALAGLRVHEIAKVHGRDVDITAKTIRVIGKGGKDALVPLHELLLTEAAIYPRDAFWFPSYADPQIPITRQSVSETISATMKRAGVVGTPHALRHWYGTSLLAAGADIRIVQELMRHSSLQSTQIYVHVSGVQRQIAIDRLEMPGVA